MTARDRLLAGAVAVLWGITFTAIHASLERCPCSRWPWLSTGRTSSRRR